MNTPEIVTWTIFETYEDPDGNTAIHYITTVLDSNEISGIIDRYVNSPEQAYRIKINYTSHVCKVSSYLDVYPNYEERAFVIERKTHPTPSYLKG